LEESVDEVLGIERHGLAILAALRALLSVSDRTGLDAFARGLQDLGWELIATDGTRAALAAEGITSRSVEDVTGQPALLGGRVKTLHPKIHAALLARRDDPAHREELKREGIEPIDLVVVNLYPFAEHAGSGKSGAMLLDQIDIGGATILRAGAKNYEHVVVVARPERYAAVLDELKQRGSVSLETRRVLASEAFSHTAAYDATVASRFAAEAGVQFPDELTLSLRKVRDLRYGENPHQQAAMYAVRGEDGAMTAMQQLHGKATSFNNMLDINAAWRVATDFAQPTVAIIKHGNPCGVASDNEITKAYRRAFMCDSVSAFGGIVGADRIVTRELAEAMEGTFYEAIIAPGYEDEALPILRQRKNLEILAVPGHAIVGGRLMWGQARGVRKDGSAFDYKRIAGGMLVQTPDESIVDEGNFKVVTERTPSLEELTDLLFAWRCVKHVTSNAIVLAKGLATVGVGPGQMSRVVAVETAVRKAGENARLAVMASDAYFPFPDGIEVAARAGVTAIIQPGGSLRDAMMIDTANKNHMAMLFTGRRHFKH
jgi:phosphoribosylaminoimidazolecarboxamide formyltransferase/IMP cyclohydrolase